MKKRWMLITVVVLLLAALVCVGVSLAKYISTLRDENATLSTGYFYFRSNVLSDESTPPVFEVLGTSTDFVLTNAQDSTTVTPADISYTLTYSVLVSTAGENEVWEKKADMTLNATLAGGSYSTQCVTVSPIVWDRDQDGTSESYYTVLVEATATAPHTKTLRARFDFVYLPMEITHTYDANIGVVSMTLATNGDAGECVISWSPILLPDNADPNGILTYASKSKCACNCGYVYDQTAGDPAHGISAGTPCFALSDGYACPVCGASGALFRGQVAATLEPFTLYRLYFFVPAELRPQADALFDSLTENGGEDAINAYLAQIVGCTFYVE